MKFIDITEAKNNLDLNWTPEGNYFCSDFWYEYSLLNLLKQKSN